MSQELQSFDAQLMVEQSRLEALCFSGFPLRIMPSPDTNPRLNINFTLSDPMPNTFEYRQPGLLRGGVLQGNASLQLGDETSVECYTAFRSRLPSKTQRWLGAHGLGKTQADPLVRLELEFYSVREGARYYRDWKAAQARVYGSYLMAEFEASA